ncbi:MAG: kynureninase [Cytophagales bacterium]
MLIKKVFEQYFDKLAKFHQNDTLLPLRDKYLIPNDAEKEIIYFAGNSLGLQPKSTASIVSAELKKWANLGVKGHFEGEINWFNYHAQFDKTISKLLNAKVDEVVVANSLTVNLHLLLSTFYKPTASKFKIIIESPSFSSDYYAVCSQIEQNGFKVGEALIEVLPRANEFTIRQEDILEAIALHKHELALVWLGAVNFYSGQAFDIQRLTAKAQEVGALVGFDLAHAIGNIPLSLHDDNVDFATWCSYKYLNSGPGGVGGLFIHQKHHHISPSFKGWWGVDEQERFKMSKVFTPMVGAKAWQLSNAPIMSMAIHKAALDEFENVDFAELRAKSLLLTGMLIEGIELIMNSFTETGLQIITPKNENERGCQLSLGTSKNGKKLFDYLTENNIITDWREPNVIRMAPVPMYNSFEEVSLSIKVMQDYFLQEK